MEPRARCHACGSEDLEVFYQVSRVPVHSCLMVPTRQAALEFRTGDLVVAFCGGCGFIQNNAFDPEAERYSQDYEETQAFSPFFRRHLEDLCRELAGKYSLQGKTVLEIGCGKGEFLVELCGITGGKGIGIDPSCRPERIRGDAAQNVELIVDLYSEKYAHLTADFVCCRHTLEHIQPVRRFVRMVRDTLEGQPGAIVYFQIPDMERVLAEQAFEDIYYEHCSYFTAGSLASLFRSCGFEVLDLYRGYGDQYLMIESRPADHPAPPVLPGEDDLERTRQQVRSFREKVGAKLDALRSDLRTAVDGGRKVVVWGSGSKAVSYLTTLGISTEIEFVVDINPHKWGRFLAGTGHEIVSPDFLRAYGPDRVMVMNAIYRDEIRARLETMGLSPEMVAL